MLHNTTTCRAVIHAFSMEIIVRPTIHPWVYQVEIITQYLLLVAVEHHRHDTKDTWPDDDATRTAYERWRDWSRIDWPVHTGPGGGPWRG